MAEEAGPSQPPPRRRFQRSERSLVCLIQALEGRKVVVELRYDVVIRGRLDAADDFMKYGALYASYPLPCCFACRNAAPVRAVAPLPRA